MVELIAGAIKLLNRLLDLFRKTPTEKVNKRKDASEKQDDSFKKTGRPKWG